MFSKRLFWLISSTTTDTISFPYLKKKLLQKLCQLDCRQKDYVFHLVFCNINFSYHYDIFFTQRQRLWCWNSDLTMSDAAFFSRVVYFSLVDDKSSEWILAIKSNSFRIQLKIRIYKESSKILLIFSFYVCSVFFSYLRFLPKNQ